MIASRRALQTPLPFDPGTQWEYGSSIDWCGQVVAAITGKRLGEVMAERVFAPLGMTDSAFALTDATSPGLATMHQRREDGTRVPTDFALHDPEVDMGGPGCSPPRRTACASCACG